MAITVDDLPYAGGKVEVSAARAVNGRLLAALRAHHAPATGFAIQQVVESLGSRAGTGILKEWIQEGFDLGNHTYSHQDIDGLSTEQVEQEIVRGEATLLPLLREKGKKLEFFRFPMNHTGDTPAKHDAIATFLAQRGYRVAACTIDNSDYLFNDAYVRMLGNRDSGAAQKLRAEYLAYTSAEIDYYAALNRQVLGYEPPQVMLLHDNRLNADAMDRVLALVEEKHYRFVSLAEALSDAAYRTPDTYIAKFGPMWGYRWARERDVKVNGSLEPDPPQWILEYGTGRAR